MPLETRNLDLCPTSRFGAYWIIFTPLKVVLRDGWKPGVHLTIEKCFKVLDVTQSVRVHAEPGTQLYPFVGKFFRLVNYITSVST